MNILAIDWGERKIGLALAISPATAGLAEPLEVIRYEHTSTLCKKLAEIIDKHKIEKIIVGVSEGVSGIAAKNFAKALDQQFEIPVETFDETLSSRDAQRLSIESGQKRKKRKEMEDAFAACIMLQNYLDTL